MKKSIFIALTLLAVAACQKSEELTQEVTLPEDGVMAFTTQVAQTRAGATTDNLTEFGISTSNALSTACTYSNAQATLSDSKWTTNPTMLWNSESQAVTFTAYAPYDADAKGASFTIKSDQSSAENFTASDFLWAQSEVTPNATQNRDNNIYYDSTNKEVVVTLQHHLSKFTITVDLSEEFDSYATNPVTAVAVCGTLPTATIATDGAITTDGTVTDVTTYYNSDYAKATTSPTYTAILIPQTMAVGDLSVELTVDGDTFEWSNTSEVTFVSNKSHTITLSVGGTGITGGTVTVDDWTTTTTTGDMEEYTPIDYITFQRNVSDTKNMIHTQDEGVITSILSKFRRCLMTSDGNGNATICYLQNDNSNYYAEGDGTTAADLTGGEGDVMVYFPEYWYKYENVDDDYFRYYFSEVEMDGYVHVAASLVGAYKGYAPASIDDSRVLYSHSGETPTVYKSQADFKSYATARGTGYQIIDFEQHCTIAMMLYAKYCDRNTQTHLGVGGAVYQTTSGGKDPTNTGTTNSIGNADTANTTSGYVNGLGIEGVFGGINEWVQGVEISSSQVWTISNPYDDNTRTVTAGDSGGWITAMALESGSYFDMVPTAASSGSNATYYADYYYQASGNTFVLARSNYDLWMDGGVASSNACNKSSEQSVYHGSRLAFRGTITEAASVEEYKKLFE